MVYNTMKNIKNRTREKSCSTLTTLTDASLVFLILFRFVSFLIYFSPLCHKCSFLYYLLLSYSLLLTIYYKYGILP